MRTLLLLCLISSIFNVLEIDLEKVKKDMLDRHNLYRARHQVGNLERNAAIEAIAQDYSEYLLSTGTFQHSFNKFNGEFLGENLYLSTISISLGIDPVDDWYAEVKNYNFDSPGYIPGTGHFSAVVWKKTKQLGCGVACSYEFYYCIVTCNYYPMGNNPEEFAENVFPLKDDTNAYSKPLYSYSLLFILILLVL